MHVVLWETRRTDFEPRRELRPAPLAEGFADRLAHFLAGRCRRPAPLLAARLAAVFKTLGHSVRYAEDRFPRRADLVVFCPTPANLDVQRRAMRRFLDRKDRTRLVAVGPVADAMPEMLQDLAVTVVKGESEQLLWRLDEVLDRPGALVRLGMLEDLDALPLPEWAPFSPWLFRSSREFWQFPTARIEASRGAPGAAAAGFRYRSAESVVAEIHEGIGRWGFYSFKFCDPAFGQNRSQVFRIAEQIGRMSQPIQFSIRSRADLLRPEMLRVLRRVGLSCVTLQIDVSDRSGLAGSALRDNETAAALCRRLGIRTIADFRIAPVERAAEAASLAWNAARRINATFAQFRIWRPLLGAQRPARAEDDSRDAGGTSLGFAATGTCSALLECLQQHRRLYYARRAYWRENFRLLLPALARLEALQSRLKAAPADGPNSGPPRPLGQQKQPGGEPLEQEDLRSRS